MSKSGARCSDMAELQPISSSTEPDRVLSDHIAAAKRMNADGTALANTGTSVSTVDELRRLLPTNSCTVNEEERGTGWRIHLVSVVSLNDLDVVVWERGRCELDQAPKHIDPRRKVIGSEHWSHRRSRRKRVLHYF